MAGEISVYHMLSVTIDGEQKPDCGSRSVPVKGSAASITDGVGGIYEREVLVPAGEMVTAWEWAQTNGFQHLTARIKGGEGFVQAAMRYNATTDGEDDLTPDPGINHWKDRSMSCAGVFEFDTERAYIHATAATEVGETSDYPTVWSSGSRVLGVADVLAFYNEDTEDDVVVILTVVPK